MLHQLTDLGTSQNKKNRAEERPCYNNYSDSDNAILFRASAQNRSRSRSRASRSPLRLTHPSTANLPITVLLCNGPLLCGFNVPIKRLRWHRSTNNNDLLLVYHCNYTSILLHFRVRSYVYLTLNNVVTLKSWLKSLKVIGNGIIR